ncbi:hypothetical protein Tco_0817386 [Tanacetum coccineum]
MLALFLFLGYNCPCLYFIFAWSCLPPSAPTILETITPTDRARDSPVISPLHDDPYMLVRQAYTPITIDIESEPLKDPIKVEETQPLSTRTTPLSPDYTPASLDYTSNTPHSDEESEPMEASETWTASPLDSTSPLSPNHPLTQTSPTPTPYRAFYYRSTARMAVRTQSTLSLGYSAKLTKAMSLSPSSFRKRYKSFYETPSSSPSRHHHLLPFLYGRVPVEDTTADELLGLGYRAARRHALELVEDPAPNMFEVGQSFRSVPDQQRVDETPTPRIPTRPIWVDLEDGTVYIDIEFDALVKTPSSPEWSSGSLPVSPASLTVSSPVASLVTTPSATIVVDEDES